MAERGVAGAGRLRDSQRRVKLGMPDRRTLIVLGTLVAAMTVTSGLLRLLEPGRVAPLNGVTLQSVQGGPSPEARLFNTSARARDWQAIVIHDSGKLTDSAKAIAHRHEQLGREGLGYHFVINNGKGEENDGVIEVGYRWEHQSSGHYLADGPDSEFFHDNAVSICLAGDASREPFTRAQLRELVWLVQTLQQRFDIPAEAVYVQVGSALPEEADLPQLAWFREQLLTRQMP